MQHNFLIGLLSLLWSTFAVYSHDGNNCTHEASPIKYVENQGQWQKEILFKSSVNTGNVYLERGAFTFVHYLPEDIAKRGELYHTNKDSLKLLAIQGHAWKVNFLNAKSDAYISGKNKLSEYYNYFLGNDPKNWAGNVSVFNEVLYQELYSGIDLKVYSAEQNFKYDFVVSAWADVSQIQLQYEGLEGLFLKDGNLILLTSVGEFVEMKPYAYQLINGKTVEVLCKYELKDNVVRFKFPKGYNKQVPLIIDPVLIASTLSGTMGFDDNYGHGATFDNSGNIYTAAINFGGGYPSTIGAFQLNYSGGFTDIVLSKLSPNGSALIYATYIGGNGEEYPHSIIVSDNNELYMFGTTSSTNYPCSAGAYDNTFGGLTDIVLTHFNATGTGIIGSTYLGGAGLDGVNTLTDNYGDEYRGEIILDANGNCYVAACAGAGFPTTPGAYQNAFGGGAQDAVFFKLNPTLSNLMWSTYLGGSGDDSGFGLRLDANGDVYACGGTNTNFLNANGYQTSSQGGIDGFIVKITNNGTAMPNRTYLGHSNDDVLFFLDIDNLGRINVYGHNPGWLNTGGTFTASPGAYNIPGSGQHIACLNTTLTNLEFLSVIGAGQSSEFIPIAFMVDICGNIYFSGHSASFGLPTSSDALFNSGGFYLGVLAPNATALSYATYYTGDHVDGGTSRFDPQGTVYQGVCSGGGFSTTANAYSTNQVTGWDIGVFKIDFEMQGVIANASASPSASGCAPFTVNFANSSTGAISYVWDFGDGTPNSTAQNPSHTFTNPGVYNVMLAAINSQSCNSGDTLYLQITVVESPEVDLGPDVTVCEGSITLNAGSLAPYLWNTGATSQTITVNNSGTYWVQVGPVNCSASDTINVVINPLNVNLGPDIINCGSNSVFPVTLNAGVVGAQYLWSTGETTQTITVNTVGTYSVSVDDGICQGSDAITISETLGYISFSVLDTIGCAPLLTRFFSDVNTPGTVTSYSWDFGNGSGSNAANPTVNFLASGSYNVTLSVTTADGCTYAYSNTVNIIINPQPIANFDFSPTQPLTNQAISFTNLSVNAESYIWQANGQNFSYNTHTTYNSSSEGTIVFTLIAINENCMDTAMAYLNVQEDLIFYVPNTFTPDLDNFNPIFLPIFSSGFDPYNYHLMIFNRWGELIFESFNAEVGWDGTYDGKVVQDGTYIWKIVFKEKYRDKRQSVIGHVNVLR